MNKFFHTAGRYWFVVLIGVGILYSVLSDNSSSQAPLPPPITQAATDNTFNKIVIDPLATLPTGTVIKSRLAYLQGNGKLKIDNGTDYDAEAKLITGGTSIFTVYIKAHSQYTVQNISDGTYWLAFALGRNWDNGALKFQQDDGHESFADTFDFTTTEDDDYYYYSTFSVTLNPVIGGTAQTNNVNETQFDAY